MFVSIVSALALLSTLASAAPIHYTRKVAHHKRGSAFNDEKFVTPLGGAISWAYNWASSHQGSLPAGVEYVPMLWKAGADKDEAWFADAEAAIASGSRHLLGFNEPDHPEQSNMTPEEAVAAWRTNMEPFKGKAKLISPAVTNGGGEQGQAWLDKFLDLCTGCTIHGVALHIYDDASNTAYFQNYMSDAAAKYMAKGHHVWFTEVGVTGGDSAAWMSTMAPFVDAVKGLNHWSPFMSNADPLHLNNADGSVNAMGQAYIA